MLAFIWNDVPFHLYFDYDLMVLCGFQSYLPYADFTELISILRLPVQNYQKYWEYDVNKRPNNISLRALITLAIVPIAETE